MTKGLNYLEAERTRIMFEFNQIEKQQRERIKAIYDFLEKRGISVPTANGRIKLVCIGRNGDNQPIFHAEIKPDVILSVVVQIKYRNSLDLLAGVLTHEGDCADYELPDFGLIERVNFSDLPVIIAEIESVY